MAENNLSGMAAFHLRVAPIYAVLGMIGGIYMGVHHDFALAPAHAHLNVLGWVSIALYGLVLARFPAAADSRLAFVQGVLAHLGAICFPIGIAIAILSDHGNEILVMVGSFLVLGAAVLFIPLVWSATARRA